jgi:hypothetical protein
MEKRVPAAHNRETSAGEIENLWIGGCCKCSCGESYGSRGGSELILTSGEVRMTLSPALAFPIRVAVLAPIDPLLAY